MTVTGGRRFPPPPASVRLVGWLFILTGVVGFVHRVANFDARSPLAAGPLWVLGLRVLAAVGGVLLLRGASWARWLVVAWLAYHVVLGALHSVPDALIHLLLLAIIAYFLFRPRANAYFRDRSRFTEGLATRP